MPSPVQFVFAMLLFPASGVLVDEAALSCALGFAGVRQTPRQSTRQAARAPRAAPRVWVVDDSQGEKPNLIKQYSRAAAVVRRQRAILKGSCRALVGVTAIFLSGCVPHLSAFAVEPPATDDMDVVLLIAQLLNQVNDYFGDFFLVPE